MFLVAEKSTLSGLIRIPGSKSHTIRAISIASLANGTSLIHNPMISEDTLSAARCYCVLGARVDTRRTDQWIIEGIAGDISATEGTIDVGNSGTTLRLAAGSAALAPGGVKVMMTGDKQIQSRPIQPLLDSLNDLGANAHSVRKNGCAPIEIAGTLSGGSTTIECFTSQYLSSLLLACPLAKGPSEIIVSLLNEADYVKITLDWLDSQDIHYENLNWRKIVVPGGQSYNSFERAIPADFSSATFFLCAGALLGSQVYIEGLDFDDSQPDKAVVDYLTAMGAKINHEPGCIRVSKSALKGIEIDMNRTPDALPAMAVTAAFADGITRLVNVPQARKKETDRIACMAAELMKLGADVKELSDGLVIYGQNGENLKNSNLSGYGDHRIVMALSIAGMALNGTTCIDTAEAMNVTFPEYTSLMTQLGGSLTMENDR